MAILFFHGGLFGHGAGLTQVFMASAYLQLVHKHSLGSDE